MALAEKKDYEAVGEVIKLAFGGLVAPGLSGDANRTRHSRIYLKGGAAFEVIIKVGGTEHTICSGVAKAKTGKLCSIYCRVRAEQDSLAPKEPVFEEPV